MAVAMTCAPLAVAQASHVAIWHMQRYKLLFFSLNWQWWSHLHGAASPQ